MSAFAFGAGAALTAVDLPCAAILSQISSTEPSRRESFGQHGLYNTIRMFNYPPLNRAIQA